MFFFCHRKMQFYCRNRYFAKSVSRKRINLRKCIFDLMIYGIESSGNKCFLKLPGPLDSYFVKLSNLHLYVKCSSCGLSFFCKLLQD